MQANEVSEYHIVFRFVVAALAVWRISFLLAREDGPWDMFARARGWYSANPGGHHASGPRSGVLGNLLGCVKCLSIWIAIPFAFWVAVGWIERAVVWLALSGVAALIDEWTKPAFEWKDAPGDELLRGQDRDGTAQ